MTSSSILLLLLFIGYNFPTNADVIELKKDNFVSLREVITQDVTSKLLSKLNAIENNYDTLYLYINSPGGDVTAGLEIINYIKGLQERSKQIICISQNAMSMAFVIFQYCSTRYILFSSTLMQHQISMKLEGKLYDINSRVSYVNTIENKLVNYQAARLGISPLEFTRLIQNDWWLFSKEIITYKAADKMVSVHCSFVNYNEIVLIPTMVGDVKVTYSACPLISYPISIIYPKLFEKTIDLDEFTNTHINFMKKYVQ
jgi:ATP-dependent Clp protease protease subunit